MEEKSAPSRKKLPIGLISIVLVVILASYFGGYFAFVERTLVSRAGVQYIDPYYSPRSFGFSPFPGGYRRAFEVLFIPVHQFDRHVLRRQFWGTDPP